ncbi:hypothetical protein [Sphingomonas sp.]|uniref:hypothetical protein n=1 Tax=Sphingomonas sp. TaxID=28214 RepID=UPI001EB905C8|nr:hypothetical protein [Sphingomonas sp.]MBX3595392.1 hypothetical protein [Sphingomonas sp.]
MDDEFDRDGARGTSIWGLPLLVALFGCLLLALASVFASALLRRQDFATSLLSGVGAGLVLWLAVLAVGLRARQWPVIVGALVALPAAGALAAIGAERIFAARASGDARTFAELEVEKDGSVSLPSGAANGGPVSAAYFAALAQGERDATAYAQAFGRFNLAALGSPYSLGQAPEAVADCGAIGDMEKLAREQSRAAAARIADVMTAIDTSEFGAPVKQGAGAIVGADDVDALLANRIETIRAIRAQCALLAKRSWRNDGGYFGFSNAADAAAFKAIAAQRQAAAEALQRLQTSAHDKRVAGREKVRAALS